MVPPGLRVRDDDSIWWTDYISWRDTRVFPRERCEAEELLEQMGLKEYDIEKIVRITNGRLFSDNISIRWL